MKNTRLFKYIKHIMDNKTKLGDWENLILESLSVDSQPKIETYNNFVEIVNMFDDDSYLPILMKILNGDVYIVNFEIDKIFLDYVKTLNESNYKYNTDIFIKDNDFHEKFSKTHFIYMVKSVITNMEIKNKIIANHAKEIEICKILFHGNDKILELGNFNPDTIGTPEYTFIYMCIKLLDFVDHLNAEKFCVFLKTPGNSYDKSLKNCNITNIFKFSNKIDEKVFSVFYRLILKNETTYNVMTGKDETEMFLYKYIKSLN